MLHFFKSLSMGKKLKLAYILNGLRVSNIFIFVSTIINCCCSSSSSINKLRSSYTSSEILLCSFPCLLAATKVGRPDVKVSKRMSPVKPIPSLFRDVDCKACLVCCRQLVFSWPVELFIRF